MRIFFFFFCIYFLVTSATISWAEDSILNKLPLLTPDEESRNEPNIFQQFVGGVKEAGREVAKRDYEARTKEAEKKKQIELARKKSCATSSDPFWNNVQKIYVNSWVTTTSLTSFDQVIMKEPSVFAETRDKMASYFYERVDEIAEVLKNNTCVPVLKSKHINPYNVNAYDKVVFLEISLSFYEERDKTSSNIGYVKLDAFFYKRPDAKLWPLRSGYFHSKIIYDARIRPVVFALDKNTIKYIDETLDSRKKFFLNIFKNYIQKQ